MLTVDPDCFICRFSTHHKGHSPLISARGTIGVLVMDTRMDMWILICVAVKDFTPYKDGTLLQAMDSIVLFLLSIDASFMLHE